ncbi:ABC transporter substrate-binding protein [Gracilibacillus sp. D59]|uniref:ABC transporter substrate-binding protein n=1 Tax=Gracilibacillus sp. D59 TaxID=3457434 RepID=UPI003FCCED57
MKKKLLFLIILLVTCAYVVACSSDDDTAGTDKESNGNETNNESESNGDSSKEEVEIRFAWWGNTERDKKYNEILDLYEEQNPHVTIIREPSTFGDYWPKLSTQVAGGNAPDLFGLHLLLYGNEYFTKDVIEPLDSYVDEGLISLDGWDQSVIEAGTYNGDLLALAKGVTIQALITNKSKIEELGLEVPSQEITYQEFKDYAATAVEALADGEYVTSDPTLNTEHGIEMWVRQKGGSFLEPDGSALGFTKEDLAGYWEYWSEMREMGAIPPGNVSAEQAGVPEESTLFAQGKQLFQDRPTNQAKMFADLLGDAELTITRYPVMEDGEFRGGEQLQVPAQVMSKNSEVKEEAAKLLNYFVNDLEATEIYSAENGLPGTKPVRDNLQDSLHPMDQKAIEHMNLVTKDIPPTTIRPEGAVKITELFQSYSEQIAFEQMTIDEAVDAFFEEADSILSQ